jgi:hypothetical protein
VPPDSVRCTTGLCPVHQGTPSQTLHLREFSEALRYNSPDCPVHHRTVSGAPEESDSELASFGNPLRQRSNGYFAPTVVCNALNARQRAQRSRARAGGTPDSLQDLSGAPPDSQAGPHVRAPTVGTQRPGDVAGAPSLVVGAINTPNHPTFKSSKFSTFQLLTRARHSKQDTPK